MSGLARAIALLVVVVVTAAATLVVTGALDGGEERALPAAGDPIPVIEPVPVGEAAAGTEDGTSGAGNGGSGSSSTGGGDAGGDASGTGGTSTGGDTASGDGSSGTGSSGTDASGTGASGGGAAGGDATGDEAGALGDLSRIVSSEALSDLRHPIDPAVTSPIPRFIDPCAGSEPGGAESICGGAPGTILGEGAGIVAPFHIVTAQSYPSPVLPRLRAGCSRFEALRPTAYDLRLVIESNNPADFAFTWGDPASLVSGHASSAASERTLWDGWTADGTAGASFGNLVQTCVLLRNVAPPAGRHWDLVVEGNDGLTTDRARIWLDAGVGTRDGRPPVRLTPRSDSSIEVSVPMFLSRQIAVATDLSVAVRVTDRTAGSCAELEPRRDDRVTSEAYQTLSADEESRLDRRYNGWPNRYVATIGGFHEGTTERLCIWWLRYDEVQEREQRDVTAPSRYRVRARVTEVRLRDSIDDAANAIVVGLAMPGVSTLLCGVELSGPLEVGTHAYSPPQPTCDLTDRGDDLGRALDLRVRGPYGHTDTTRIPLLRDPCAGGLCDALVSRDYRVTVPGRREIVGLCGGSGSCDPPTAEVAAGSALVRIDFVDGPTGSGPEWGFGAGEAFAAAVTDVGESEAPRVVEAHVDRASDATPFSPAIDVVVAPSVASRVRAFLFEPGPVPEGSPFHGIPAPCLGPGGTGTATEAGTVGRFDPLHLRIDGLCPGWTYLVGLELTSLSSGAVSYYGTRPPDATEGEVAGAPLWTSTPSVVVDADADLTLLEVAGDRDGHLEEARLGVGGLDRRWDDLARLSPCADARARVGSTFRALFRGGYALAAGQENEVVLHLQIPAEGSGCASAAREDITLRQTLTLEEFLAGFTLESPAGDPVRVRVTVTPRV